MTLADFGQACLDAKATFVTSWNALKAEAQTDAKYQELAQAERDAIDVAHANYAAPTNPPGHPIRPH